MLNVLSFGATGNGVTDDTLSIQNCVNAAALNPNGDKVYFPAGQYKITNTILIQNQGIELVGDGQLCSLLLSEITNNHAVQFQAPSPSQPTDPQTQIGNCGVRHLAIHQVVQSTVSNACLLFAVNVYQFHADNLRLWGLGAAPANILAQGLVLVKGTSVYLSNIDGIGAQTNGIQCYKGNDYMISNLTINMIGKVGRALNILDVDQGAVEAVNCNFLMGEQCMISNTSFAVFTNCYFDSAANAVSVSDNSNHVYFNSCEFSNRPGSGLSISDSDNVHVNNSMIMNCGLNGVEVYSGSGFSLTNSTIDGNNTSNSTENISGVLVGVSLSDFQIIGNRIGNFTTQFKANQQIGINVNTGSSDRYIITNNIVTGNTQLQIADNGSGKNKFVLNNVTA